MKKSCLILALVLIAFLAVTGVNAQTATAGYDLVFRSDAPLVDGDLSDTVWADVPVLNGEFRYPWESVEAPGTTFKAFQDGEKLYFAFSVADSDVVVEETWNGESTVDNEDRVELFFAAGDVDRPGDNGMPLYYCIEVDPKGRTHDYSVKYYRIFDSEWAMENMEAGAVVTGTGYDVEGAIPLATFRALGMLADGDTMKAGVFRAEFSKPAEDLIMRWISWVDPKTVNPDFHVNSAFGEFRILK